jgi:carboxypeptidase Taq
VLRYEIERALINGEIEVDDIPALWDENAGLAWVVHQRQLPQWLYAGHPLDRRWLWLLPVLHPRGNVRRTALPRCENRAARASGVCCRRRFSALFDWLRQNIWQHGSRFSTSQLITQATGEDLNIRYFREHLTARYL